MKKLFPKIFFTGLIIVCILIGLNIKEDYSGIDFVESGEESSSAEVTADNEKLLQIHFLDVGQGDAIYIRTPDDQDILIDGGPDKKVLSELGEVMPFWDREIDVVILTHPHSDQIAWPILRILNLK